jgi:hypothetical protein
LSKKKRVNRKAWFSDSCKDLYNTVINKFPQNADNRKIFTHLDLNLEDYVNLKKNSIKVFEQLSNSQEKNPRVLGSSK